MQMSSNHEVTYQTLEVFNEKLNLGDTMILTPVIS